MPCGGTERFSDAIHIVDLPTQALKWSKAEIVSNANLYALEVLCQLVESGANPL